MATVGIVEARRHFSRLLRRALKGETITITNRGTPIASLVPIQNVRAKMSHQAIVEGMRRLRRRVKPDTMSVREMVIEGRRY